MPRVGVLSCHLLPSMIISIFAYSSVIRNKEYQPCWYRPVLFTRQQGACYSGAHPGDFFLGETLRIPASVNFKSAWSLPDQHVSLVP